MTEGMAADEARLAAARANLDRLDGEIISLLLQRLRISVEIGQIRWGAGLREVRARDRGDKVLARYRLAQLQLDGAESVSLEQIGLVVLEQSAATQLRVMRRPQ